MTTRVRISSSAVRMVCSCTLVRGLPTVKPSIGLFHAVSVVGIAGNERAERETVRVERILGKPPRRQARGSLLLLKLRVLQHHGGKHSELAPVVDLSNAHSIAGVPNDDVSSPSSSPSLSAPHLAPAYGHSARNWWAALRPSFGSESNICI
jgi:hypothetical protein